MAGSVEPQPDFSQPWRMSDVVLLVDDERLHVHQGILAMWSPVFESMFAELKRKNSRVLTLDGQNPHDMRELLLFIYPTILRPINEANCYCLLELAKQFTMDKVTEECEEYLMSTLRSGSEVVDLLVLAAKYNMRKLREDCLRIAKQLDWKLIQRHDLYEQIDLKDYRAIMEQRLKTLEMQLGEERRKLACLEGEVAALRRRSYVAGAPASEVVNPGLASPRMVRKQMVRPSSPTKPMRVILNTVSIKAKPPAVAAKPPPVPKRAFNFVKPQPVIKQF